MQIVHDGLVHLPEFPSLRPRMRLGHKYGEGNVWADAESRGYDDVLSQLATQLSAFGQLQQTFQRTLSSSSSVCARPFDIAPPLLLSFGPRRLTARTTWATALFPSWRARLLGTPPPPQSNPKTGPSARSALARERPRSLWPPPTLQIRARSLCSSSRPRVVALSQYRRSPAVCCSTSPRPAGLGRTGARSSIGRSRP